MTPARRHRERVMSDQRKPRGLARFREREVTRITKAVRVGRRRQGHAGPRTGRYTITVSKGEGTPPDSNAANPWDKVNAADEERPS